LIITDDLEDDVMAGNPDRRRELKDLYDQALIPAGDRKICQYVAIGTILHDDSLIAKLVSLDHYPEYRKLLYKALWKDPKGGKEYSLWPEKWSVEDLLKLQKDKPDVFAKEYQNDPVSGLLSKFKKEDFRYWVKQGKTAILKNDNNEIHAKYDLSECKAAIACDLAWESKRDSDFSVIMPGYLTPNADILIGNYVCRKGLKPNDIEEILFSMEERLRAETGRSVYIGFEKAKLEKIIKHLLRQAMSKRNKYLLFKDLKWDTDKITRIVTRLQPRYAQHAMFHQLGMGELEHQLLRVPSGTHDDLADAAQGLTQILENPVSAKKKEVEDDHFEWLRNKVLEKKGQAKKKKGQFLLGRKKRHSIPFKQAYR
jgi:hypothetical protein